MAKLSSDLGWDGPKTVWLVFPLRGEGDGGGRIKKRAQLGKRKEEKNIERKHQGGVGAGKSWFPPNFQGSIADPLHGVILLKERRGNEGKIVLGGRRESSKGRRLL